MSRSRNRSRPRRSWSCGNHGGCPWCEGNRTHADKRAPTVAEQLDSMCTCPACRVGCEGRCFASIVLPPDVLLPEAWCAACGDYYCDGVGAPAFCETR